MRRHRTTPRADWAERAVRLGFDFAVIDGEPYWDESACWEFTAEEVDVLDDATAELHRLAMAAAEHAVRHGRAETLGIPRAVWPLVVRSWERQEPSLYGRMDLRWDGTGAPKLLEYNADTPTALYEASVVQWDWLTSLHPDADQFNGLHEALLAAWPRIALPGALHVACQRDSAEDRCTVEYLRDTATQAGVECPFLYVDDIGWNGREFVDLEGQPIRALFKLYPWEWLLADAFGNHVGAAATRWIEPPWRMLLSGKGILALLWELFPDHPNLLAAYREAGRCGGPELRKPLWGREGANVTAPGLATDGPYGAEGFVHQEYAELPCVDGRYAVIGSWLIEGTPRGVGIREDDTAITRDTSRFVPHFFRPRAEETRA
jgi:glutathionylspermidine synthase